MIRSSVALRSTSVTIDPDRLGAALAGLPEDVRSALELAVVGGFGYREIARRIGQREETVVQRLRDGLSHLSQELGASHAL